MKLDIQKFAVTKSTTFKESNISIEDNTSTLTITIEFSPNNNETYFSSKTLKCTCNGKTLSKSVSLSKGGKVKTSFVFNGIKHNADGTKSVSWNWSCATGTSILGTINDSGTKTLTKINRYGRVTSVTGNTTNSTITITYQSYNANYTYDLLIYRTPNESYTTIYNIDSAVGSHNLDITIWNDYFNVYPNQETAQIYYIIETHIDESTLYDESFASTINLNSNAKPSITIGTLTEADETMQTLNWGIFVKNKSKLNIPITATGVNNSTIKKLLIVTNGETLSYENTSSHTFTTNTIKYSGALEIIADATDSRNRLKEIVDTSNTILDYENPIIRTATAERCRSDGTPDRDGTYILYSFNAETSLVDGHNAHTFRIGYKRKIDDTYTYVALVTSYNQIVYTNEVSTFTISPDYEYDIVFEAIDSFTTTSITRSVDVGFDLLNFNPSGKSIAIGKVSEATSTQELLEIALETEISNNVTINGDLTMVGDINGTNFVLNSDVFYSPGDVVEIGLNYYVTSGYVTSNTSSARVTIITPKRLDNITTITCTSLNIEARTANGYLNNETGYHEYVNRSGYTISCSISSPNSITINLNKSTAYTNVSNNTLLVFNGYFKFTLA